MGLNKGLSQVLAGERNWNSGHKESHLRQEEVYSFLLLGRTVDGERCRQINRLLGSKDEIILTQKYWKEQKAGFPLEKQKAGEGGRYLVAIFKYLKVMIH